MARKRTTKSKPKATSDLDAKAQAAAIGWLTFTWANDTARTFFKLPHVAVNWLALILLSGAWWLHWASSWRLLAALTLGGLLYTIGRAARHLPGHAKATDALLAATAKPCGHPRSTRTSPVDVSKRLHIRRWAGPATPATGSVAYSSDSPAASSGTRWTAEKAIESLVGEAAVFDYEKKPGWVAFAVVADDDPRLAQKATRRWVESTVAQLFPTKRGARDDISVDITWTGPDAAEDTTESAAKLSTPNDTPSSIDVEFGAYDVSDRAFREKVERTFDTSVARGVEWVYDWSMPGALAITAVDPTSGEAVRKRVARKINDVVLGALARAAGRQAAAQAELTVARWVPDGHPAAHTPIEVQVTLGTADYSSTLTQQQIENSVDQALEAEWADRVWLAEWTFGAEATLGLTAVPQGHQKALRKSELRRLRQVVTQKFQAPKNGTPVDVEVHEWLSTPASDDQPATENVAVLTVRFGTVDVTKPDTRREFQDHFDSLTTANDWRYDWVASRGLVQVTSVPALPSYKPFPAEGTDECEAWNEAFRKGKIILGPAKGGYDAAIDLNKSPHTMIGGSTGMGKSVLLTLVLYGALMNPDHVELVIVDPKVTDFTWTPGYPNVRFYAVTDARRRAEEIREAVQVANSEMMRRQGLLRRFGVENLGELRRLVAERKIDLDPSEIPCRLIIFFDEGGDAFNPSGDPDTKALQDEARKDLESIGMLGRAMEVNLLMAAQKPTKENIGTLIRSQCKNKVGIGPLDSDTSRQVMGNTLCTRLDEGSPKGRGYYVNDSGQELLVQTYFLPKRDTPDLLDPTVTLQGVQERVADLLDGLGWRSVDVPTQMVWEDRDGRMVEDTVMVLQWVDATRVDI